MSFNTLIRTAIRLLGMPFLADPPESSPSFGVAEYPGFHTTSDMDVAASYAVKKVYEEATATPESSHNGKAFVSDYPIVVALNMEEYTKLTDYDAEKMVLDRLKDSLNNFLNYLDRDVSEYEDNELEYELEIHADGFEHEYPGFDADPYYHLVQTPFQHMENPVMEILGLNNAAQFVREYSKTGVVDKKVLMDITKQYRYANDVPYQKVVTIWYVDPVAGENIDYELLSSEEQQELEEKWPGFTFPDVYKFNNDFNYTLVWGNRQPQNVEYHGTTYERLKQAVPEIALNFASPPSPPYSG